VLTLGLGFKEVAPEAILSHVVLRTVDWVLEGEMEDTYDPRQIQASGHEAEEHVGRDIFWILCETGDSLCHSQSLYWWMFGVACSQLLFPRAGQKLFENEETLSNNESLIAFLSTIGEKAPRL